ncbi:hypothetical protein GCM10027037_02190 [Mucilaginibacter koreensis]
MYRILLLLFVFLFCFTATQAQNSKTGTWGLVTLVLPSDTNHRWGGYTELQTRTNTLFDQFFYYEVKGGVSYAIKNNFIALLGTGRYTTYNYGHVSAGPSITETRLWEQFILNEAFGRFKFENRIRIEQRWLNIGYRNRFRYRLNLIVPFNHQTVAPKTVFASIYNEVFFNNEDPNFERNRISAALGYKFDKSWSFQAGWINQYNHFVANSGNKNNLLLILMYQINRKKKPTVDELPTFKD